MSKTISKTPAPEAEASAPFENPGSVGRDLLDAITIDYGPAGLLGRVFIKGVACAQARGVRVRLCSLTDLDRFNREYMKDWPLMPVFRPDDVDGAGPRAAFAILGENSQGEVVATQAARFFDWSGTSLKSEVESLRMMYGSASPPVGATAEVSSDVAGAITGRVAYSGSTWFRPDYRGRELSGILPRISRALALSTWNTDTTISFMDWRIVKKGVAASYGYVNLAPSVTLRHVIDPEFVAAIGWITRQELIDDAEVFLSDFPVDWSETVEAGRRHYSG